MSNSLYVKYLCAYLSVELNRYPECLAGLRFDAIYKPEKTL